MPLINCPICKSPFDPEQSPAAPFCSERCRRIDLGRWLDERHALPIERAEEDVELPPDEEG